MTQRRKIDPTCCTGLAVLLIVVSLLLYFGPILYLIHLPWNYGWRTFTAQAMMSAVNRGDLGAVKQIVKRYPDMANCTVPMSGGESYTALDSAIYSGHTQVAIYLIDHGANPNADSDLTQPIYAAIDKNDATVVRSLVAHGVSLKPGEVVDSPLAAAIRGKKWDMCKLLRELGANDIPLAFEAAAKGDIQLLRAEVSKSPSVLRVRSRQWYNIVHLAVRFERTDSIRELARLGADLNTPLPSAHSFDEPPVAKACGRGDLEMVKTLADMGAHLEWPGVESKTENGLPDAILSDSLDIIRYLLDKGVDPNAQRSAITLQLIPDSDDENATNLEIAQILVAKGFLADKAALDRCSLARPSRHHSPVEEYLLKHAK